MIEDVLYVISSHGSYQKPLERLLWTMRDVPRKIVVSGGHHEELLDEADGLYIMHVTHNSFDMTGAVGLMERSITLPPYLFFLHDTMEFLEDTDELVRSANPTAWSTAAFGGQCNLILCRTDYFFTKRTYVLAQKNCSKTQAIGQEGGLWKQCPEQHRAAYSNGGCIVLGKDRPYDNAERIKELYTSVNIIKWKANYGQTNDRTYILAP